MENLLTLLVWEGKESINKGRLNVSSHLYLAANVASYLIPAATRCRSNRWRTLSILSFIPLPRRVSIKDVISLSGSVW